jgi:hypothetical protein
MVNVAGVAGVVADAMAAFGSDAAIVHAGIMCLSNIGGGGVGGGGGRGGGGRGGGREAVITTTQNAVRAVLHGLSAHHADARIQRAGTIPCVHVCMFRVRVCVWCVCVCARACVCVV